MIDAVSGSSNQYGSPGVIAAARDFRRSVKQSVSARVATDRVHSPSVLVDNC